MIDTCVWLDTAKDIRGERLLATLRVFSHWGRLELLVPDLVDEEYGRNRDHVVSSLSTGMRAHLRTARTILTAHSAPELSEQLLGEFDDAATRGPMLHDFVEGRFNEVQALLAAGRRLEADAEANARAVDRALRKVAPFHHAKNSVADALIIEIFRRTWQVAPADEDHTYVFVTHNTKDFSDPKDTRQPHPDLADCFSAPFATYATSLESALTDHDPRAAAEIAENDFPEEARSGREILAAEKMFFDLIWYERSLDRMHPLGDAGRERVEATYAKEELGPYTDFEWGMLNGKLSALRWVMGDEWDFLDT
ncbi:hypothetical protein NBCG_01655 [Nocardioidaceae bacterium Broad-1]|nr:hypothetical protein NBCG_01655 [Nocardioidaceae bacterium Broad-1]